MNSLNRWKTHGYNNVVDGQIHEPPAGQLTTEETKAILKNYIKSREERGEDLKFRSIAEVPEGTTSQEEDNDTESEGDDSLKTESDLISEPQVNDIGL